MLGQAALLTEVGKLCIETWRYLSIWAALASDPAN
jgi:hypothetical protein